MPGEDIKGSKERHTACLRVHSMVERTNKNLICCALSLQRALIWLRLSSKTVHLYPGDFSGTCSACKYVPCDKIIRWPTPRYSNSGHFNIFALVHKCHFNQRHISYRRFEAILLSSIVLNGGGSPGTTCPNGRGKPCMLPIRNGPGSNCEGKAPEE